TVDEADRLRPAEQPRREARGGAAAGGPLHTRRATHGALPPGVGERTGRPYPCAEEFARVPVRQLRSPIFQLRGDANEPVQCRLRRELGAGPVRGNTPERGRRAL